jgi:hypothetical protein
LLPQRHGLGSGRAPIGTPDEKLAINIESQPLEGDQLASEFFETVVIESEAELDTAVGDAALGNKSPDDFFRTCSKSTLLPSSAAIFVLAPGWSLARPGLLNCQQSSSRPNSHLS